MATPEAPPWFKKGMQLEQVAARWRELEQIGLAVAEDLPQDVEATAAGATAASVSPAQAPTPAVAAAAAEVPEGEEAVDTEGSTTLLAEEEPGSSKPATRQKRKKFHVPKVFKAWFWDFHAANASSKMTLRKKFGGN